MSDVEAPIHRAILQYLRLAMPRAIIHHSPNENALSSRDRKGAAISAARLKGLGMVPGFPDLVVFPYASVGPLLLEVKSPKGKLSPHQVWVGERFTDLGYRYAVVRSVTDVQAKLAEWAVWAQPVAGVVEMRGPIS